MRPLNRKLTNSLLGGFQTDAWLSQQIGKPAYRLSCFPLADLPAGPCFCYVKIPESETQQSETLEASGFSRVETLLTYEKQPSGKEAADPRLREARPTDRERVKQIAGCSFRFSRFHVDPGFGPGVGNRIKGAWAENFFRGTRGDRMLVAEESGNLAGFILLLEKPEGLVVDLIAVDPACQGRGLGRALLLGAETKSQRIVAGTQMANASSCRMYQKCGYTILKSELVYHLHR
jgi:ribosomal protein S18 acetylase RimI-like enzyme